MYNDTHMAWQQRVSKEERHRSNYARRAYAMGSSRKEKVRLSQGPDDVKSNLAQVVRPDHVKREVRVGLKVPFARSKSLYKDLPEQITSFDGRYNMSSEWQLQPTTDQGTLAPSYSFPFHRLNQD